MINEDNLPKGIIRVPTEEEFEMPEGLKQLLHNLFVWQEASAKTYWVLGEPLLC